MAKIPQEIIVQARQADLVEYLRAKGVALKRVGHEEYQHPDHDSLYISGNHFKWFSRNKGKDGNNAITLVMELYDLSFAEAVQELTGYAPTSYPTDNNKPSESVVDARRAIAYLNKTRGISYDIIRPLLRSGHIKQDARGNCVFAVTDFDGNHVCDFLRGTTSKDFKQVKGEQHNFGFTVQNGKPLTLIFFEAPIDLLSFIQLGEIPLDNTLLIAMGGCKANVFRNYFDTYSESSCMLAVDNDTAGQEFVQSLYDASTAKRVTGILSPSPFKDWNEKLMQG